MADPGIIRNRAKIDATISNARVTQELVRDAPGALDALLWSFAPPPRPAAPAPRDTATCRRPPRSPTAASTALQEARLPLRRADHVYALMQSAGMVDDHVAGCWRAERLRPRSDDEHELPRFAVLEPNPRVIGPREQRRHIRMIDAGLAAVARTNSPLPDLP